MEDVAENQGFARCRSPKFKTAVNPVFQVDRHQKLSHPPLPYFAGIRTRELVRLYSASRLQTEPWAIRGYFVMFVSGSLLLRAEPLKH